MSEMNQALTDLLNKMNALYAERDWDQFHSPKNLAMNLGVEVGEVMEHFRWITEQQSFIKDPKALAGVREEIGDVFVVLLHLCDKLGIDPIQAGHENLEKVSRRYPSDKAKGSCAKYTHYETSL